MNPEVVLGFDPAPGDDRSAVALADAVRSSVRALTEANQALTTLSTPGPGWDGPAGEAVLDVVRAEGRRVSALIDGLGDCLQAIEAWRAGATQRHTRAERIADLASEPDAQAKRERLVAEARELGDEHASAASTLATAFETLAESLARGDQRTRDAAGDLDRALARLAADVDAWVAENAEDLVATAQSLGEVATLTTVVTELLGVSSFDRSPEDADGVKEIVRRSPGSHRLIRALRRQWTDVAPEELPEATFADLSHSPIADLLARVGSTSSQDIRGSGE